MPEPHGNRVSRFDPISQKNRPGGKKTRRPRKRPETDMESSSEAESDEGELTYEEMVKNARESETDRTIASPHTVWGVLLTDAPPRYYHPRLGETQKNARKRFMIDVVTRVLDWLELAAEVRVDLPYVKRCNGKDQDNRAQMLMENYERRLAAKEVELHAGSMRITDQKGRLLLASFSYGCRTDEWDTLGRRGLKERKRMAPKILMVPDDPDALKMWAQGRAWHGLHENTVRAMSVGTQGFIHNYGINDEKTKRSRVSEDRIHRFPSDVYTIDGQHRLLLFPSYREPQCVLPKPAQFHQQIEGLRRRYPGYHPMESREEKWYHDHVGVLHLDRCWPEKGHEGKEARIFRSKDLVGSTAFKRGSVDVFTEYLDKYVQECIAPLFYAACGLKKYCEHRISYRAASLNEKDDHDEGFHTGHAIVYNDVVHQHIDSKDSGYCVIFCTGSFEGGHLYLPDLDMGFLYRPGSVFIFKSSRLYHGVTAWKPKDGIDVQGVLPGRRAHVLYTKASVHKRLKKAAPGSVRRNNRNMDLTWEKHEFEVIPDHPLHHSNEPAYAKLRAQTGRWDPIARTPDLEVSGRIV